MQPAQISGQLRFLVDKVMGEAGLYSRSLAASALKQAEGDACEAVVILRGILATLPRKHVSEVINTREMFVQRRISSAFHEIPGGQILGPSRDYSQRLLEPDLVRETAGVNGSFLSVFANNVEQKQLAEVRTFSKVTELLQSQGLLRAVEEDADRRVVDITREPISFPAPRSARLQALARAETGAIMALAYSGMRGQGGDHPTIGEVRVGRVRIHVTDARGRSRCIGQLQVTEAENISKIKVKRKDAVPYMSLGYGLCFGQNETKAISMGMLDRSMRIGGDGAPAISQEFVLYHTEGSDAWGSLNSMKLPQHVEFASELNLLRLALQRRASVSAVQRSSQSAASST